MIGALHSLALLTIGLQRAYNARWYEEMDERLRFELTIRGERYPPPGYTPPPIVHLTFLLAVCTVLSIGLALGKATSTDLESSHRFQDRVF